MIKWRRVDEIITYYGKGVTPKYVEDSSIIVLNQKCIRNNKIDFSFAQFIDDKKSYNEDKFLRIGDLLVNSTGQGTAGRVAMIDYIPEGYKIIVDSHILVLRTNNFFESKCLNYSLFSIESMLQTFMDGSTGQGEFDKVRLFNIKVGYPIDNITQQKIAAVLSSLDDKIELNNKINIELEAMAKTLYDYWFVQFDFPNKEGKPYKSSGGKMVYNPILKREIPVGWEVKTIGDYCRSTGGFAFKSSWWTNEGDPVIKIKDIQENYTIDLSDLSYVDLSDKKVDEKFIAKPGNILIAMTGATVGKYAIVPYTNNDLYVNQRVGYFNLGNNPVLRLPFLINSLNQPYFREAIFTLASGAAQPNISNEQINNISLIIPIKDLIDKYNQHISDFYKRILLNQTQNQELAQLRDWLLPMLMNGQVKVEDTYTSSEPQTNLAAEATTAYQN